MTFASAKNIKAMRGQRQGIAGRAEKAAPRKRNGAMQEAARQRREAAKQALDLRRCGLDKAAAARAIARQSAAVARLTEALSAHETESTVARAIFEGRLPAAFRDWATALGRKSINSLRQFISSAPKLPAVDS